MNSQSKRALRLTIAWDAASQQKDVGSWATPQFGSVMNFANKSIVHAFSKSSSMRER